MGEHGVRKPGDERDERTFTRAVLRDLLALERMLDEGMIESGVRRAGAEQEMFLVDAEGRPAPVACEVLARLDGRFTSELALFNLEANLPPIPLDGQVLRVLEAQLEEVLSEVTRAAALSGAAPLLAGMLPTLRRSDLDDRFMTPEPRYRMLLEGVQRLRSGPVPILIRGTDQLDLESCSVMLESANASLQLHIQVDPDRFVATYNAAQLLSAPLLAAAVGSPLLLGRRLWQETRIALFEQSVDARTSSERARGQPSRVTFGEGWLRDSVLEIFREDAARRRVLLVRDASDDPLARIDRGEVPSLSALTLHNGTIWRWNRACYGLTEGRPHLRIESRILPSGPTVLDEVANAALFYGAMLVLPERARDIAREVAFEEVEESFLHAARHGLDAQVCWVDGGRVPVRELLLGEFLPLAREGLGGLGVPPEDVDRYLGVLEERVRTERTAARWILEGVRGSGEDTRLVRARSVTRAMMDLQRSGEPVHRWPPVPAEASPGRAVTVGEIMTTDLFTVRPEDLVDLATSVMSWEHVRHVPVENAKGEVAGLVSHRALLRIRERQLASRDDAPIAVADIMDADPPVVDRDLPVREAADRMFEGELGCLLVVEDGKLAGIVTERDLLRALCRGRASLEGPA